MKNTLIIRLSAILLIVLTITQLFHFNSYASPDMKKGLLAQDPLMLEDTAALGTEEVIYNITTSNWINNHAGITLYFKALRDRGIRVAAVLLNDRQDLRPQLLPDTGGMTGNYYFFNVFTEAGKQSTAEYIASMSAELKGLVGRYILGNEIQDQLWNCRGARDIDQYISDYSLEFRTVYSAIKAADPEAEVYIPFAYGWTTPANTATTYRGRDCLDRLNARLNDTDYGIAWHAYPDPITSPVFWDDAYASKDPDAGIINCSNLSVLSDYLRRGEMLKQDGSVRNLILSEQGFSALNNGAYDEELQAAAFALAYRRAMENPDVKAFILNRQVDAKSEVQAGRAYGLWSCDMNAARDEKAAAARKIHEVFREINASECPQWIRDLITSRTGQNVQ